MSNKSTKLKLNENIDACSENAIELLNENTSIIDGTYAFSIEEVAVLPPTATSGDAFLVTGDNNIYYWTDSYQTYTPTGGEHIYDKTNSRSLVFNETLWVDTATDITTASNLGSGSEVFKQKVVDNLEFRTLTAGSNISLTENANDIVITAAINASSANYTLVDTSPYTVQMTDVNLVVDLDTIGSDAIIIMPDPATNLGRKLKFFKTTNSSNGIILRNNLNTQDIYKIRDCDIRTALTDVSGYNHASWFEFIAFEKLGTGANLGWFTHDCSDKVITIPYLSLLLTVDGSYDLNSPLVITQQEVGSLGLYKNITFTMPLIVESVPANNSRYVLRMDSSINNSGSWFSYQPIITSSTGFSTGEKKDFINFSRTVDVSDLTPSFGLLEFRLGAYRLSGSQNGTIGDSIVGGFESNIVITREL